MIFYFHVPTGAKKKAPLWPKP